MKITSLKLKNFKNYEEESFSFSENINVICGENAQGKTNLLEALFYLSCVKPINVKKEKDLIKFGKNFSKIEAVAETEGRELEIIFDITSSPRRIFVNGIKNQKVTDYIGSIKTVLFTPDDLSMIKEGPALRRRFLNIAISQLKPNYVYALSRYNKILEQKNALLKQEKIDDTLLDIYNEKLASQGAIIIKYRQEFTDEVSKEASLIHNEMSNGREILQIVYKKDRYIDEKVSIGEALYKHMSERKIAEIESQSSLVGPHRDDLEFLIAGVSAKDFASQGQIRTAILSTKLAEREVFYKTSGEYPILLLDDVLSELDSTRQNFVLNKINCGQVFITSCENLFSTSLDKGKIFTIEKGSLISDKEF